MTRQGSRVTLQGLMLALVSFGLVGLAIELVFLEHYEEPTMGIPFAAIVAALAAIALVVLRPGPLAVWVLRGVMALFVLVGMLGVVLHYQGGLEFQLDMDPEASPMQLFWKVVHMKAPPMLAPGVMVQLGLLGLLATWRHPDLGGGDVASVKGESR